MNYSPGYPSNWVYDTFATTVNMPTYLIAIIVSDYKQELAPEDIFRVPVSVCTKCILTNTVTKVD